MKDVRNILVAGATGMVGRSLVKRLQTEWYAVKTMGRDPARNDFVWDASSGKTPPPGAFENLKAVVNLAGSPVAIRWTAARQSEMRASRVNGTLAIAEALAALPADKRPESLVNASGIAVYGIRRQETRLTEESPPAYPPGSFLPELTRDWEAATDSAKHAGIRVVTLRTAVALAPQGGALAKLLPVFRCGLGGPIGDGKRRMAWIALEDLVSLILFSLRTPEISGPLNAAAPEIVTNAEFATALGTALGKSAKMPAPVFALKLAYGRMAEETILSDLAPYPEKALKAGFKFAYPRLSEALAAMKLNG